MKVLDVMKRSVASVRRDEPLSAAVRLMWDCDCGSVPVKDEAGERVVGMITDRDICIATWSKDRPPSSIRISEAMSPELYAASPDESISSAEALMRSRKVRRVPVLDVDQRLVGILSLADIATESRRHASPGTTGDLAATEVVATLADICQPRPRSLAELGYQTRWFRGRARWRYGAGRTGSCGGRGNVRSARIICVDSPPSTRAMTGGRRVTRSAWEHAWSHGIT